MCETRDEALVDLLYEIVRHVHDKDGDERKRQILEKWQIFYERWIGEEPQ